MSLACGPISNIHRKKKILNGNLIRACLEGAIGRNRKRERDIDRRERGGKRRQWVR